MAICLAREVNKLRNQLRSGAAKELDPLIARYNSLASSSSSSSALMADSAQASSSGSSGRNRGGTSLASEANKQSGKRVSNMTTRNLVNQSESMVSAGQLEPPLANQQMSAAESSSSVQVYSPDEAANFHSKPSPNSLTNADSGQHGSQHASTAATSLLSNNSAMAVASSSIRGFFAKTYKDAVGQALAIVIGSGALIFLLNLIIVLVIALRSARTSSSRAAAQENGPTVAHDANQVANFKPTTGAALATSGGSNGACLSAPISGHDFSGAGDGGQILLETKRLTSSFKGNKQQQRQQAQEWPDRGQQAAGGQCVGGGQAAQRAPKSIKFNLPELQNGADCDKVECISSGANELQLGCPVSLSNLDIMALINDTTTVAGMGATQAGRCVIHGGGQHNEDELHGQLHQCQYQQQPEQSYQLMSSPPSYMLNELSDEIDLDDNQLSGDDYQGADYQAADLFHKFSLEAHNQHSQHSNNNFLLLEHSNSSYSICNAGNKNWLADSSLSGGLAPTTGPIYVSTQHEVAELEGPATGASGYQRQTSSISTSSGSNHASHKHQYNLQHQHQAHLNRSLGSSSLTSPYGSQSTSTNNTSANVSTANVSTAIYTIRPAVMKQGEMRADKKLELDLGGAITFFANSAANQTSTGFYSREGAASGHLCQQQ